MSILTELGAVDFSDTDTFGTIHIKLASDLLTSTRNLDDNQILLGKAMNIIKVCCEPEFDDLICDFEWSPQETDYADSLFAEYIEAAAIELLHIAYQRAPLKQKRDRRHTAYIESTCLAEMMAYVMDVANTVSKKVQTTFLEQHGAMNFYSKE